MTLKERDAIESGEFTPRFSERFKIHEGLCTVCKCDVNDHWVELHNAQGWIGCTGALIKRVQELEQICERDSRRRGESTMEDSETPAVESRVDGDAA